MQLKDGEYRRLTAAELTAFEQKFPDIVKYWLNPTILKSLKVPKAKDIVAAAWDDAARDLMNKLWRFSGAKIFHEPVDPDRLNIPDYLEIVKTPIDFGTIKQRL